MGREARAEAEAEVGSGVNLNLPPIRDPIGREGIWGSGSPQCEWSLDSVKENVLWDPNFLWLSAQGGEDGRVCSVPAPAVTSLSQFAWSVHSFSTESPHPRTPHPGHTRIIGHTMYSCVWD